MFDKNRDDHGHPHRAASDQATPIAADSGMPSNSAPSTSAVAADEPAPASVPVGTLRFSAPLRSISRSPA